MTLTHAHTFANICLAEKNPPLNKSAFSLNTSYRAGTKRIVSRVTYRRHTDFSGELPKNTHALEQNGGNAVGPSRQLHRVVGRKYPQKIKRDFQMPEISAVVTHLLRGRGGVRKPEK